MKATVNVVWRRGKDGIHRLLLAASPVVSFPTEHEIGGVYRRGRSEGSGWDVINGNERFDSKRYLGPYRTLAEAKKALEKVLRVKP